MAEDGKNDRRSAMTLEDKIAAALDSGREKADEILALRAVAQSRRADALKKNQNTTAMRVQMAAPGVPQTSAEFQTAGFLAAAVDAPILVGQPAGRSPIASTQGLLHPRYPRQAGRPVQPHPEPRPLDHQGD